MPGARLFVVRGSRERGHGRRVLEDDEPNAEGVSRLSTVVVREPLMRTPERMLP